MGLNTIRPSSHVLALSSKARKLLGALCKLKGKLSREALELAYITMIRSKIEYASVLLGDLGSTASATLDKVQYHAGCLTVTGAMKGTHSTSLLRELEWDNLSTRRHYHSMVLMYKMTHGLVPVHLQSLIPSTRGERRTTRLQLRNTTHLHVPRCRTKVYRSSFIPHASTLWNHLPQALKEASSLNDFKRKCKDYLFTPRHNQLYRRLAASVTF
ncbi:uncharacterized protein LOC144918523 [Branchiostoma floridae x Branchiostoma belcheri]